VIVKEDTVSDWVRCTNSLTGGPVYLNLEAAMSVLWNESEGCTIIAFPGGEEDVFRVVEKPEAFMNAREHGA
jgi:hypothetical protein